MSEFRLGCCVTEYKCARIEAVTKAAAEELARKSLSEEREDIEWISFERDIYLEVLE